jgi:hypothetical protein
VNNEKVTLQFTPSTQADEDVLTALLPQGEITDVSQLPSNVAGYLLSVRPELSLNGEVFLTDSAMRLGAEINLTYQISGPLATYAPYNYSVIAGSYLNVPLVAQTMSPQKFNRILTDLRSTRSIIENNNSSQVDALTRENVLGDLFFAGGLGYWASYDAIAGIFAHQRNFNHKLEFAYGSFGYEPEQNVFFGIPRGISAGEIGVNMLVASTVGAQDGSLSDESQFRFQTGLISSALEHSVPEYMFNDESRSVDGISAVKALTLASASGQKIYQIDDSNLVASLNEIQLDPSIENEIRSYVTGNRIAIAHTNNISVPGWTGAGYILLDQDTGIGSYKITGGGNGGAYNAGRQNGYLFATALTALTVKKNRIAGAALGGILLGIAINIAKFNYYYGNEGLECYVGGFGTALVDAEIILTAAEIVAIKFKIKSLIIPIGVSGGVILAIDKGLTYVPDSTEDQCK